MCVARRYGDEVRGASERIVVVCVCSTQARGASERIVVVCVCSTQARGTGRERVNCFSARYSIKEKVRIRMAIYTFGATDVV